MNRQSHILIVGGGLAGLTCAIHLSKAKIPVVLIEKNEYPTHKVCGEYISNEVLPYLEFLDIQINELKSVTISQLHISTTQGDLIKSKLPLGGFGVSRYTLDAYLRDKAILQGVEIIKDQVIDIHFNTNRFVTTTANKGMFFSQYVIGAYGKRALLDKQLNRDFSTKKSSWLAIKAHYKASFDPTVVALHNFRGGYCGLSTVDNNRVNSCYLVSYDSFKEFKNITTFQENILYKNPHLQSFFENAIPLFKKPITISQINFEKKKPIENHIFMTGDAAGVIHPLCGNGMAMALQSAQLLCTILIKQEGSTPWTRDQVETLYTKQWNAAFAKRLFAGRILQKIVLNPYLQQSAHRLTAMIPSIVPRIIKQTHGKPLVC